MHQGVGLILLLLVLVMVLFFIYLVCRFVKLLARLSITRIAVQGGLQNITNDPALQAMLKEAAAKGKVVRITSQVKLGDIKDNPVLQDMLQEAKAQGETTRVITSGSELESIVNDPAIQARLHDAAAMETVGDKDYFYYREPRRRGNPVCGIGIHTNLAFDFRMERLDIFDKFAATVGFARRMESGDPDFDAQVYAYSTNPLFYDVLGTNATLRQTVLELFRSGVTAIFAEKGRMVAHSGRAGKFISSGYEDEFAASTAQKLHSCLRSAASVQVETSNNTFSRAEHIDQFLKSVLQGALLAGIIGAFFCGSGTIYQMADTLFLAKASALYAVPVILIVLVLLGLVMGRTPYGADAFRNYIQCGVPAVMLLTFSALYAVNIALDTSPPVAHAQRVVKKYYTTGKHNSHTYYAVVNSWNRPGTFDVHINSALYNRLTPGQDMSLLTHAGYLNMEWISLP